MFPFVSYICALQLVFRQFNQLAGHTRGGVRDPATNPQRRIARRRVAREPTGTVHFQSQMLRLFFVRATADIGIAPMQRLRLSLLITPPSQS